MKIKILVTTFLSICTLIISAQPSYQSSVSQNTADLEVLKSDFYDWLANTQEPDSIKAKAVKKFQRFEQVWEERVASSQTYQNSFTEYSNAFGNYWSNPSCTGQDLSKWEMVGPYSTGIVNMGFVGAVYVDPSDNNFILVGSGRHSGMLKSEDGGNSWVDVITPQKIPAMYITSFAVSPNKYNGNRVIYASTGLGHYSLGIVWSVDDGNTWSILSSFPTYANNQHGVGVEKVIVPQDLQANQSNIVYAISGNKFYKSTDDGQTWSTHDFGNTVGKLVDMEVNPTNKNQIIVSSDGITHWDNQIGGPVLDYRAKLLISNDGGTTWTEIFQNLNNSDEATLSSIHCVLHSNNNIYAHYYTMAGAKKIYMSTNQGLSWSNTNKSAYGLKGNSSFQVSSETGNIYEGGTYFYRGGVYSQSGLHADIRAIQLIEQANRNDILVVGHDGGISISTDNGSNWTCLNGVGSNGINNNELHGFDVNDYDNTSIVIGLQDNGTKFMYENEWKPYNLTGGDGENCEFITNSQNEFLIMSNLWLYKKRINTNGTYSHIKSYSTEPGGGSMSNPSDRFLGRPIATDPVNPNIIYTGRKNGVINVTLDDNTWNPYTIDANASSVIDIEVAPSSPNIVYAVCATMTWNNSTIGKAIYRSTDYGQNWTDISSGVSTSIMNSYARATDLTVSWDNPNKIWVSMGNVWKYNGVPQNRVYRCDDASLPSSSRDWVNMTNSSLPPLPVTAIVNQPGTDRVFIGTDGGIFYWEYNDWHCFSEDFPITWVKDLKINRQTSEIYAGTYGYGLWKSPLPCVSSGQYTVIDSYSGDVTWNSDKPVGGPIIVKDGKTLTINNGAVISMGENAYIIVEPAARLVIDNATITSGCGSYWDGIQVLGDTDAPQTYSVVNGIARPIYQGEVIIKNGGTIRNSIDGIMAIKKNLNGSYDWSKTGGIIRANGAKFINNNNSIWIGGYHFNNIPNRSRIKDCHFEWNNTMLPGHTGYSFIGLTGTNAVYIVDNEFVNKTNNDMIDRGCGIYAYSSTIYVNGSCASGTIPCSSYNSNEFEGLYYGIYSSTGAGQTNKTININHNNFVNVYNGIYLNNAKYPRITLNDFQVADFVTTTPTDPYGIWLNNCNGYKVEENSFTKSSNKSHVNGILVYNSGTDNNEIYNNILTDLDYAIECQQNNRGTNGDGLKILCNDMSSNNYDITVFDQGIGEAHQIAVGNDYVPAGDKFTTCYQNSEMNIHVSSTSGHINYLSTQIDEPTCVTLNKVTVDNTGSYGPFLECPSKISNGNINTLYSELAAAKIALNSSQLVLNIWKDGGDANLENEVATTQPWDIYVQFNELIAESPYLSDEVLLATIYNTEFTSLMVKLIMVANPHASHNDEIMQAIYDRLPEMPQSYIDEILAEGDEVSQLEILEANVAADNHLMNTIGNNIKYIYRTDSINSWAADSLHYFIARQGTLNSRYELASYYLGKGEFDNMNSTLSAIPNTFTLEEDILTAHSNWLAYYSIAQSVAEGGLHVDFLEESQIGQLETIVGLNLPGVSGAALALLYDNNPLYDGYQEYVLRVTEYSPIMPYPNQEIETSRNTDIFKVYPNPANDYITVEYRTGKKYSSLTIEIRDLSGKLILNKALSGGDNEELIGIGDLKPGIYTLTLLGDGNQIEIEKLTVLSK